MNFLNFQKVRPELRRQKEKEQDTMDQLCGVSRWAVVTSQKMAQACADCTTLAKEAEKRLRELAATANAGANMSE